jgi:hypothetical protein
VSSIELFLNDGFGRKSNAELHPELLGNPAADVALSRVAVKRAVEQDGMTLETAERLYGLNQILSLALSLGLICPRPSGLSS